MSNRRTLALAIYDLRQTTADLEAVQMKLEKHGTTLPAQSGIEKVVKALTEAARCTINGNLDSLVKVTGVMNQPQVTQQQIDRLVGLVHVLEQESDSLTTNIQRYINNWGTTTA